MRPHLDLLIISVRLNKYMTKRILVDTISSINLINLNESEKLRLHKKDIYKVLYTLVQLGGESILIMGVTNLLIVIRDEKFMMDVYVKFIG